MYAGTRCRNSCAWRSEAVRILPNTRESEIYANYLHPHKSASKSTKAAEGFSKFVQRHPKHRQAVAKVCTDVRFIAGNAPLLGLAGCRFCIKNFFVDILFFSTGQAFVFRATTLPTRGDWNSTRVVSRDERGSIFVISVMK